MQRLRMRNLMTMMLASSILRGPNASRHPTSAYRSWLSPACLRIRAANCSACADVKSLFIIASGITGWLAVWGTLRLIRTRTFAPFVAYRVLVGVGALVLYTAR